MTAMASSYRLPDPLPASWRVEGNAADPWPDRAPFINEQGRLELKANQEQRMDARIRAPRNRYDAAQAYEFTAGSYVHLASTWLPQLLYYDGPLHPIRCALVLAVVGAEGNASIALSGPTNEDPSHLTWGAQVGGEHIDATGGIGGSYHWRIRWDSAARIRLERSADGAQWSTLASTTGPHPLTEAQVWLELITSFGAVYEGPMNPLDFSALVDHFVISTPQGGLLLVRSGAWVQASARVAVDGPQGPWVQAAPSEL